MNEITKLSRELRKNLTNAEKILWAEIRNKKLGIKFRRQHPLVYNHNGESCFFISDFACLDKKLIIELDGKVHEKQKERDAARDYIIHSLGFTVIRFTNDMIQNRMQYVKEVITSEIDRIG